MVYIFHIYIIYFGTVISRDVNLIHTWPISLYKLTHWMNIICYILYKCRRTLYANLCEIILRYVSELYCVLCCACYLDRKQPFWFLCLIFFVITNLSGWITVRGSSAIILHSVIVDRQFSLFTVAINVQVVQCSL